MSVRGAARTIGVGKSVLAVRYKTRDITVHVMGAPAKLGVAGENRLVEWLLGHSRINNPVSQNVFKQKAAKIFAELGDGREEAAQGVPRLPCTHGRGTCTRGNASP